MIPFALAGGRFPLAFGLVAALVLGAYVKGCSDERERHEAFRAQVEAIGKAQHERTLARIAEAKLRKKEADDAHAKEIAALRRRVADAERRMRDAIHASGGPVPAVPGTAESSPSGEGLVCFQRDELDRGIRAALERFLVGTAGVLSRGDEARTAFKTCAEWALKEFEGGTRTR